MRSCTDASGGAIDPRSKPIPPPPAPLLRSPARPQVGEPTLPANGRQGASVSPLLEPLRGTSFKHDGC